MMQGPALLDDECCGCRPKPSPSLLDDVVVGAVRKPSPSSPRQLLNFEVIANAPGPQWRWGSHANPQLGSFSCPFPWGLGIPI